MEEIEAKILNVDVEALEAKIIELGGVKQFDRVFHRAVFDYEDLRLDQKGAWVRVRDEGDRVVMSFKQRLGYDATQPAQNDTGMLEEEIVVSDFETAASILRHIGLTDKFFQENRRVQYQLDGVELDIDHWPLIRPYLELEAVSWGEIDEMIVKLGYSIEDKKIFSTTQIYDLAGIRDKDYQILTFDRQVKKT